MMKKGAAKQLSRREPGGDRQEMAKRHRREAEARKRERMASDPVYREKCLSANKAAVEKYRRKNLALFAERVRSWQERNKEKRRVYAIRATHKRRVAVGRRYLSREEIADRLALFGHRCAYCGTAGKMELDHLNPVSRGGDNDPENIVPACKSCNSSKHDASIVFWLLRGGPPSLRGQEYQA